MERQRRHHRRVEAEWPITCHRITANGLGGEPFAATTVDLSAGGMAIVTDEPIFRPTLIAVGLDMAGLDLTVRGTVLRVGSSNGRLMAALQFDGLTVQEQIEIGRVVFREAKARGQGIRTIVPGEVLWWHARAADACPPGLRDAAEAV